MVLKPTIVAFSCHNRRQVSYGNPLACAKALAFSIPSLLAISLTTNLIILARKLSKQVQSVLDDLELTTRIVVRDGALIPIFLKIANLFCGEIFLQ